MARAPIRYNAPSIEILYLRLQLLTLNVLPVIKFRRLPSTKPFSDLASCRASSKSLETISLKMERNSFAMVIHAKNCIRGDRA